MEVVLCDHGVPCILKTGLKPGPFLNKSVYMCGLPKDKCDYLIESDLKLMNCPLHKPTLVSMQMLSKDQKHIVYFCSKHQSGKFCGKLLRSSNKENEPNTPKNSSVYVTPESQTVSDKPVTSSDSYKSCSSYTLPVSDQTDCSPNFKDNDHSSNSYSPQQHFETKAVFTTAHESPTESYNSGSSSEEDEEEAELSEPPSGVDASPDNDEDGEASSDDGEASSDDGVDTRSDSPSPVDSSAEEEQENEVTSDEGSNASAQGHAKPSTVTTSQCMEKKPATIKPVSFAYSEDKQENKAGYNKGFIPSVQSVHSRPVDLTDSTSFYRPSFMTSSACMKKKPVPLPERLVDNDASRFQVGHQTKKVQRQYMEIEHLLRTQAAHLPDGGAQLRAQQALLKQRLVHLKATLPKLVGPEETSLLIQRNLTAQSKHLTTGAIVHLHSSLENCPTEDTLADDPPGLTVPLMIHQKRALAWMQWREEQTPAAGILADDMGLGKTLSVLSLVWLKKGSREDIQAWRRKPAPRNSLVKTSATLVVCPASLMLQWEEEAQNKIGDKMSVYVYHGKKITHDPYDLVNYDLVVTTYTIVGGEGASLPSNEPEPEGLKKKKRTVSHTTLFQMHWRRVVLDEAHMIKNPKSAMSLGCCQLSADYRWAVTGTPIQNCLKDFYSLMKFIHLAPFDDYRIWKDTVEKKKTLGMQRLNTMVSSLVLRRTKDDLSSENFQLTKKMVTQHSVDLNEDEMAIHRYMYTEARKVMYSWLVEKGEDVAVNPHDQTDSVETVVLKPDVEPIITHLMKRVTSAKGKGSCVLWLLLRLRQICCHPKLLVLGLNESASPDESNKDDVDLDLMMDALSLNNSPPAKIDLNDLPEIFQQDTVSTKIDAVVTEITRITSLPDNPPQKCVVVSQWTKMLDIVGHQLTLGGISCTRIDGTVNPGERLNRVKLLNSPHKCPSVMLLSLQAGGVGLNLIGANHLFILDMHWNPALEQQASDRCHRVGQTRDVYIHKFVCASTIEERILKLQEQKLQLASNVMTGASQKSRSVASKLSLNDLRNLFELS